MYTEEAQPVKRQILITEVSTDECRYLTEGLTSDELVILAIPDTLADASPEMLAQTEILVPFVYSHIGREQLEKMPKLRYITTRSTGYEHIRLPCATQRGIVVSHVPGYGESAVAEHTFALLLALSRKLYRILAHERGKGGVMNDLCGMDLFRQNTRGHRYRVDWLACHPYCSGLWYASTGIRYAAQFAIGRHARCDVC